MDENEKIAEKLSDEIKFLQVRITELEKAESRQKIADELLRKTELQQKAILNNIPDIAWLKDKESRFIAVNDAFGRACGLSPKELMGKNDFDIWPPKLAQKYRADDKEVMATGKRKSFEEPLADKEGKIQWLETIKTPIYNDQGEVIGTTGIARDITERKRYEERLREARSELEIRVKVRTAELSRANEELRKEIAEREKLGETLVTDRKNTQERVCVLNKELVRSNERLKKLLLTDAHTGLYNHRYLEQVIEAEFHRAKRSAHPLSVIMMDLDYFKSINDVYGHQFGDLVLKQFARRLKMIMRKYDIIIRSGGEEFIIVSPDMGLAQSLNTAQRILESVSASSFGDRKHAVKLKLSLAAVSYPEDGAARGSGLVNLADKVLGKAKEFGGNRVYSSLDLKNIKYPAGEKKNNKALNIKLLQGKIEKLTKRSNQGLVEAIFAFAKTIELKDHYTGEHVEETVRFVTEICNKLGLPREEIEMIKQGAALHDLGKIGISEKILLKKSKLTRSEFEQIKKHPQIGADILRPIHFLRNIIPLVFYHHEKWDGTGYPSGIKGEEIPIGARIIAIADVYQALTSDRPYRKAYPRQKAMRILKAGAGSQFDPRITDIFLKILQHGK